MAALFGRKSTVASNLQEIHCIVIHQVSLPILLSTRKKIEIRKFRFVCTTKNSWMNTNLLFVFKFILHKMWNVMSNNWEKKFIHKGSSYVDINE